MEPSENISMKEIERLYFELYPRLCVFAENILKDSALAKGFVQEVFLTVCEKKDRLKINTSYQSYLVKAVYNRCMLHKRKLSVQYKHYKNISYSMIDDYISEEELDEDNLAKLKMVEKAIISLPEQCRKVFLLNKKDGLAYAKIADLLGLSVKTVDNHISKAMKKIREYIGNNGPKDIYNMN
jgi:RNA polymerase sigma-70 factor (ECF subfamily)